MDGDQALLELGVEAAKPAVSVPTQPPEPVVNTPIEAPAELPVELPMAAFSKAEKRLEPVKRAEPVERVRPQRQRSRFTQPNQPEDANRYLINLLPSRRYRGFAFGRNWVNY
jgi:hypothetical protein